MEDEKREKIKAKARRLNELAKRGIGGEKTNAQRMLDDLLRKHGMQSSDIDSSLNSRVFTVDNDDDKTILMTTILSINPYTKLVCDKKFVTAELDEQDYFDVKDKYAYFSKLFRVEKELLVMAFFEKNKLYFAPTEQAHSKFRDGQKKPNEAFEKVKMNAENIRKNAEHQFKANPLNDIFSISDEEAEIQRIQQLNLARLQYMTKVMFKAEYVKGKSNKNGKK